MMGYETSEELKKKLLGVQIHPSDQNLILERVSRVEKLREQRSLAHLGTDLNISDDFLHPDDDGRRGGNSSIFLDFMGVPEPIRFATYFMGVPIPHRSHPHTEPPSPLSKPTLVSSLSLLKPHSSFHFTHRRGRHKPCERRIRPLASGLQVPCDSEGHDA